MHEGQPRGDITRRESVNTEVKAGNQERPKGRIARKIRNIAAETLIFAGSIASMVGAADIAANVLYRIPKAVQEEILVARTVVDNEGIHEPSSTELLDATNIINTAQKYQSQVTPEQLTKALQTKQVEDRYVMEVKAHVDRGKEDQLKRRSTHQDSYVTYSGMGALAIGIFLAQVGTLKISREQEPQG